MFRTKGTVIVFAILWQLSAFAQTPKYSIIDLGRLSARQPDSSASAINDNGLAGVTLDVEDRNFAHTWSQAQGAQAMFMPSGAVNSVARSISYSGDIAGWVSYGFNADKAAVWNATGAAQELPTPGVRSRAFGINDYREAVGEYALEGDFFHTRAFIYDLPNGFADLGSLPGTTSCSARAINRFHEVVGYCLDPTDGVPYQAFMWSQAAGMRPLLPKYQGMSVAHGSNDVGQVVGMVKNRTSYLAFVTTPTTGKTRYIELAIGDPATRYSVAFAINDAGETVGESNLHAFIDANGTTTDLNALIPQGTGWVLTSAFGINGSGQIVGAGIFNGEWRGFLLTPEVPTAQSKVRARR